MLLIKIISGLVDFLLRDTNIYYGSGIEYMNVVLLYYLFIIILLFINLPSPKKYLISYSLYISLPL
jgi:hypothetical protein